MQLNRKQTVIKSIQRGTVTATSATSLDVAVSSVDISKAVLNICGYRFNSSLSSVANIADSKPSVVLLNSTTIRVQKHAAAAYTVLSWELVEYA